MKIIKAVVVVNTRNDHNDSRHLWDIPIETYKNAHFAVYPAKLAKIPILATCPENGIVLDPFMGSGTTGEAALKLNRSACMSAMSDQSAPIFFRKINIFF